MIASRVIVMTNDYGDGHPQVLRLTVSGTQRCQPECERCFGLRIGKLAKTPPTRNRKLQQTNSLPIPLNLQIPLPPKPLQRLQIPPRLPILHPQQLNPPIRQPDLTTHTPTPPSLDNTPHDLCVPRISAVDLSTVPSATVTFRPDVLG